MNLNEKLKLSYQKIKKAKNILIITHVRPDGDAIASMCTMIEFMETINKKYSAWTIDVLDDSFLYLPQIEKIQTKITNHTIDEFDLIITLDCGSFSRMGVPEETKELIKQKNIFIIDIDHHPQVDEFPEPNLRIKIPEAAATTEILYTFFSANEIRINKNLATCILSGILTDTANFLYQINSEKALVIASEMLKYGAQFNKIISNTLRNKDLETIKLQGKIFNNLQINKKYDLAFSVLTEDDLKKIGKENLTEGMVNFLGNLADVKAVMFLREESIANTGKTQIKGSLRSSHPIIDVSKIANFFGGGGHPKASGFLIPGKLIKKNNKWQII